jgi:hypothetical protein
MGQYYYVVNLTKKQFIDPSAFNDLLKLCEFVPYGKGTMMALGVLLCSGNGQGGGDILSNAFVKEEKKYIKKEITTYPDVSKFNSPLFGSWAGDQIVIAGDYDEHGKYLTETEIEKTLSEAKKQNEKSEGGDKEKKDEDYVINVYKACSLGIFKDISQDTFIAIKNSNFAKYF